MRCLNCEKFSFSYFCNDCKRILSECTLHKRVINSNLDVYSFYFYSEIKKLIHSKHKFYGSFIYSKLAKFSFYKFGVNFSYPYKVNAIALDDSVNGDYSQIAILLKALKSKNIKPIYGALKALCDVKYSGKTLAYRQQHKRNYTIKKDIKNPVILVDDIITTGESMKQAKEILNKNGIEVLFGLTLANAEF
ncbi:MAG: ComF family protein [Campylobacter sputorum]|uniref:ComF family protein n=1 Tax=Campylobacter sputorum TaxID=206 RepID=UPI000B76BD2B|nr:ComF family protein [Campylobacter sputorum]ASM37490.1 transformation system, predicted amidophosphoribosyltransferase CtsW [Campylobacter sputorum bv. faecalis CCUG 20703]ASM39152.1 transformation system, predicted amidophosphoribosyltransferase CtsW [Campylobacter sputorum bv. paraureolyticus LMG 11764]MDY6120461.1 ComF family protein [Campylobacter sputorum]